MRANLTNISIYLLLLLPCNVGAIQTIKMNGGILTIPAIERGGPTITYSHRLGDLKITSNTDWSLKSYENNSNFQHGLMSLRWIHPLLTPVSMQTQGTNILLQDIITSFISWHQVNEDDWNVFYLGDHTIGIRLKVFLKIIDYCKETECSFDFEKLLKKEIRQTIEFGLYDPRVYRGKIHNHQAMLSLALLQATYFTDASVNEKELALNRVKAQILGLFERNGVAKEHSVSYQIFDTRILLNALREIEGVLGYRDYELLQLLMRASDVIDSMYVSSDATAAIGDTFSPLRNYDKWLDEYSNFFNTKTESAEYTCAQTDSLSNYQKSGLVISNFLNEHCQKSQLLVNAMHYSAIHKHYDDTSYNLVLKGTPIVVDPGYDDVILTGRSEKALSLRKRIKSPQAHNTIYCGGEMNYRDTGLSQITLVQSELNRNNIKILSTREQDINVERFFKHNFKGDLILKDKIIGREARLCKSRIHFGHDVDVSEVGLQRFKLTKNGKELGFLSIQSENNNISSNIEEGDLIRNHDLIVAKVLVITFMLDKNIQTELTYSFH